MNQLLKAIYHNGTFILETPCDLPEGTEVELLIESPKIISPPIADGEAKQHFLESLIERMQQNQIPSNAPKFTRKMLHERR